MFRKSKRTSARARRESFGRSVKPREKLLIKRLSVIENNYAGR